MTPRFVDCLTVVNVRCWNCSHLLGEKFILYNHQNKVP
ncbi:hypothetical protein ES332_A05G324400v1 [Gossypium tomentosum]|uniref:Yippee domain-containing protein n=1 Tax=Gossypium tomentosum TaxID=34277 RepID=A0A5D2QMU8_GOSTO|nr:hypothetical protein ES332_A05G324400v1 [Gossypium tomentosum]